ncbi:MAG TPA: GtrA family protein [Bryobacteraceae bacterium]|nr:GtrA family protein [Bryobacteraceae bacterium]
MTGTVSVRERVFRFYAVGSIGVAVQLSALAVLTKSFSLNYMVSTALAVEMAVIHNFFWHEHWTWRGRTFEPNSLCLRMGRLWKFNVANGLVSIVINVVLTRAFVEVAGIPYMIANLMAIGSGSVMTFLINEMFVFTE